MALDILKREISGLDAAQALENDLRYIISQLKEADNAA